MAWTMYSIDALDTLFFRDGRPFVAGEGTDVGSRFPPTPLTLQGLIRSKLLATYCSEGWQQYKQGCNTCTKHTKCKAEGVVGSVQPNDNNRGTLKIRGPWILVDGCPVLPIPMDIIATSDNLKHVAEHGGEIQTAVLAPKSNGPCHSNLPGALTPLAPPQAWERNNTKFEGVPGFISWNQYREYLCGNAPKLTLQTDWWRPSDLWGTEVRPGLEIEDGRSRAKSGMLYFAKHVRLKSKKPRVTLAVELDELGGLNLDSPWRSPFGGERRAVVIEKMETACNPWEQLDSKDEVVKNQGKLKLVLTQMAWLQNGWYPNGWSIGNRLKGQPAAATLNGHSISWIASRMERPEHIGGWDLAKGDQKPVRRFVPPGAVYYLSNDHAQSLRNTCLSDTAPNEPFSYAEMGLGHVLIGTWKEAT